MTNEAHPCPFCIHDQGWSQLYFTLDIHIRHKHPEMIKLMRRDPCDGCDNECTDCTKDNPPGTELLPERGD